MAGSRKKKRRKSQASRTKRKTPTVSHQDMPELQQARSLWAANHFPQSLAVFEKAVRKEPNNRMALLDAARAFGARFEFEQAEKYLARILETDGGNPETVHLVGQSYRMIFRPEKALDCFHQALSRDDSLRDTHLELAILLERRHRLDEAFAHIDACLKLKPDYTEAKFVKARILRRTDQTDKSGDLLHEIAAANDSHWLVKSQAWSELAKAREKMGDYDGAMVAALECKRIVKSQAGPIRRESVKSYRHLRNVCESITAADIRKWTVNPSLFRHQRIALLTGSPRSGTTLLEKMLDAHSDIITSDERPVFPRYIYPSMLQVKQDRLLSPEDFHAIQPRHLIDQRTRYLRYIETALQESFGDRLLVDKNPSMLMLIPAFIRLFPECRFIISLRDPRDVILSCFLCYLPLNTVSVNYLTLSDTVDRFVNDMTLWLRLREMIPDAFKEVRYEDIVDDFPTKCREIMEFLDTDWDDAMLHYRERLESRDVNSPTYEEVTRPIYRSSIGRWRCYEKYLEPHLDRIASFVRAFAYDES